MLLSCASPMVPGSTLTEKAELLREWGYDGIAVFQAFDGWNGSAHDELLGLEARTGVRPVEFVFMDDVYGNAMADDLELRASCREMYRSAARICAELGAVTEIEYEYGPQDPLPLFEPFRQLDDAQKTGFIEFYSEMLALVAGTDARILLEPINRYESGFLNRTVDNIEIIDAIAHPNAGLLPDTFHMSIEEADIASALRAAGGRTAHVHLGENNRLLPGSGSLDWAGIIGALSEVGYEGYLNLECSTEGDPARTLPATATFLRGLLAA